MAISVVKKNMSFCEKTRGLTQKLIFFFTTEIAIVHWGKADDRNYSYGHCLNI
jgi:hypothetical protein